MKYIEAPYYPQPNLINWRKSIFLAGSITGASDWQKDAANALVNHLDVFNPRRGNFDVKNPNAEREQITWEHHYLDLCETILFYFAPETLSPITLLEYGATLEKSKTQYFKKIYVAIHPDYKRKNDVIIQTELRNPQVVKNITFNLLETLTQIVQENQ